MWDKLYLNQRSPFIDSPVPPLASSCLYEGKIHISMFTWAFSSARLQAPAAITAIEKIRLPRQFLLPNSNSVGLYQEQLAFVAGHPWIRCKIIHEPSNYCWNHLGVVFDLQSDDPFVLRWWIRRDVGKVAVQ